MWPQGHLILPASIAYLGEVSLLRWKGDSSLAPRSSEGRYSVCFRLGPAGWDFLPLILPCLRWMCDLRLDKAALCPSFLFCENGPNNCLAHKVVVIIK